MTADEFKAARTAMGYTQQALAAKLGKHVRQIQNYEMGFTPVPLAVSLCMSIFFLEHAK